VARFEPPTPGAGAPWGQLPYPNDLLVDADGKLALQTLPGGPNASESISAGFLDGLRELDGAGVASGIWFGIDGDVDPATLDGNVALVDLETGDEVAINAIWREDLDAIGAVLPLGTILREDRAYGAYITSDIAAQNGTALAPSPAFVASLEQGAASDDPAIAAAQDSLRPLLERVSDPGKLVAATVFRTETTSSIAVAMRDVVRAADAPSATVTRVLDTAEELDSLFGEADPDAGPGGDFDGFRAVPHGNIGAVVHGAVKLPDFRSDSKISTGLLEYDQDGKPLVKGVHRIEYMLHLPVADSYDNLPVVVYVHGLGRSRLDSAYVADTLTGLGMAVIAIDMPFHGNRRVNPDDTFNEITGETVADGVADRGGLFPVAYMFQLVPNGGLAAGYLPAVRSNVRQAAIDLVSLAYFITDGDAAPIAAELAEAGLPDDLSFAPEVAMTGESLGGLTGLAALALDSSYGVAAFTSPAAGLPFPAVMRSAAFGELFTDNIAKPFDIAERLVPGDELRAPQNDPIIQMYTGVMAGAEAGGFLHAIRTGELRGGDVPNVLLTASWGDDTVHNSVQEHIAAAIGIPAMRMSLPQMPPGALIRFADVDMVDGPVSNNAGDGSATMVMTHWYPASHAVLRQRVGTIAVEPGGPPFIELDEPKVIENPIVELHDQIGGFLDDYFLGRTPSVNDPFLSN